MHSTNRSRGDKLSKYYATFILLILPTLSAPAQNFEPIYQALHQITIHENIQTEKHHYHFNGTAQGTAIGPHTILSVAHVTHQVGEQIVPERELEIIVSLTTQLSINGNKISVIKTYPNDLAILHSEKPFKHWFTLKPFTGSTNDIFAIRLPNPEPGIIFDETEDTYRAFLSTHPGDSGSPIVNTKGQIIGITIAIELEPMPITRIAKINKIVELEIRERR